jgi:acetyl esterase
VDHQVKLIMNRISAASNIEEPRRAYFLYSKFAGPPESVFRVEDRKIPGPGGSIPIRLYTPHARTGLPLLEFFHGDGFVAGKFDRYDVLSRAVTNRCDCLVVSVGYWLAPENRYPVAVEDAYAATKWVAEHAAEIGQNPKTPLSATPPGTFGLPPFPGSPQTPTSEANRARGDIDLRTLAAHFRVGQRFRRLN